MRKKADRMLDDMIERAIMKPDDPDNIRSETDDMKFPNAKMAHTVWINRNNLKDKQFNKAYKIAINEDDLDWTRAQRKKKTTKSKSKRKSKKCKCK